MEIFVPRILFYKRAGILIALCIGYDLVMLQFFIIDAERAREYVLNGQVMTLTFALVNIWHDYLVFRLEEFRKSQLKGG